ncbi:MAG TPA: hypothetical protein DDZ68_07735 [Parvularcula sp.]|nr:hypothetical protein [Parvularcula sp.]
MPIISQCRKLIGARIAADFPQIPPGSEWTRNFARLDCASADRAEPAHSKKGAAPLRVNLALVRKCDAAIVFADG